MSQFAISAKVRAQIFIFDAVYDISSDMSSRKYTSDSEHPLLTDRKRLDRILDVMYAKIQKTLFPGHPGQPRPRVEASQTNGTGGVERILAGTGVSADDVLSEAFIALLEHPSERLESTWEGLAVTIAHHKAVDELRASRTGLRGTNHRPELRLVSGDVEQEGPEGEIVPSLFEFLPSNWGDPEVEYSVLQDVLKLCDLAREILDDRDQEIFFAIHFCGYRRKEVADQLGLTSQRIGQIYSAALRSLEDHPDYPFKPTVQVGQMETRRNL